MRFRFAFHWRPNKKPKCVHKTYPMLLSTFGCHKKMWRQQSAGLGLYQSRQCYASFIRSRATHIDIDSIHLDGMEILPQSNHTESMSIVGSLAQHEIVGTVCWWPCEKCTRTTMGRLSYFDRQRTFSAAPQPLQWHQLMYIIYIIRCASQVRQPCDASIQHFAFLRSHRALSFVPFRSDGQRNVGLIVGNGLTWDTMSSYSRIVFYHASSVDRSRLKGNQK